VFQHDADYWQDRQVLWGALRGALQRVEAVGCEICCGLGIALGVRDNFLASFLVCVWFGKCSGERIVHAIVAGIWRCMCSGIGRMIELHSIATCPRIWFTEGWYHLSKRQGVEDYERMQDDSGVFHVTRPYCGQRLIELGILY